MSREHLERLETEVAAKVEALIARSQSIDASLANVREASAGESRARLAAARAASEGVRQSSIQAANDDADRQAQVLVDGLAEIVERIPTAYTGSFSESWDAGERRAGAPELIRRGRIGDGPALYPLFHDRGWFLDGPAETTGEEIQNAVLRAVAGLPLKHLRIDVFDPRIEGRLGAFAPLRSAQPAAFPTPATSADGLRRVLDKASETAAENAELIATERVRTLGELWRARGIPVGEYRIVVVLGYPEGIDRESQDLLVRLARSGGPNGISLLIQHDEAARSRDEHVRVAELAQHLRKSRVDETGSMLLADYPEAAAVRHDGAAPSALARRVIDEAVRSAAEDVGPVIPLSELIAVDAADPWTGDGTDGLETVIGRVGQRDVTFALRSRNPPIANALVGGAVGQGKSNLLLDVIYGLAARYSPADLELQLLDFKKGLEFQRFAADSDGANWLPHVTVLSLESDRAFGVAVLKNVRDELTRRSELFKAEGVGGIEDYRRSTGRPLSRLVLIVDEFQVLFDGEDRLVDEAVELLELIARQGRASGVHLLLSSQTTTGVSGLRLKGESIFSQFPLRLSLKNTTTESEAILSQGNKAAAELTYRGEIVVNRNFGLDPEGANERAVSAYAEPDFTSTLQKRLYDRDPHGSGPMVFVSTRFATWPVVRTAGAPAEGIGLLGRPVAVTDEPLILDMADDVDQAVAVVGADESLVLPVLASLTATLAPSLEATSVVVLDFGAADSATAGAQIRQVLSGLESRGLSVHRAGRRESPDTLASLRSRMTGVAGATTLVVAMGLQRLTGLDDARPENPEDEEDYATFSLRDVLSDLVQRGALNGVHFVGWWSTLRSVRDQLGFDYQGVRHFVTARLGAEDWHSLTSHSEPVVEGFPRVGHVDRLRDGAPATVIPFDIGEVRA